ncbi:MAG: dual specificity protein phosphatase family protein [Anaerolineae bacterium]|nr:dual specificity protein phosphatase family protein [Anaerolineae bacterium]
MKISWIEPGVLAASGIPLGVKDLQSLHKQGIRAIVTLTEHPLTVQQEITSQKLTEIGLTCFHAPVVDQYPPDVATVWKTAQFIKQMKDQGQPVLIHCHAGVGRTGTMLHAYYLAEGFSLDEARAKVKARMPTGQFIMLSNAQRTFLEELATQISGA